jgi:hypothetical protein
LSAPTTGCVSALLFSDASLLTLVESDFVAREVAAALAAGDVRDSPPAVRDSATDDADVGFAVLDEAPEDALDGGEAAGVAVAVAVADDLLETEVSSAKTNS